MSKLKNIFCAIFRHSHIHSFFFGYVSCARCREQLGDRLGGAYADPKEVGVNCNCQQCFDNYRNLGWKDTFLVPYPFEKDENGVIRVITKEEREQESKKLMEDIRNDRERRDKRTEEWDGLWERLPEEVVTWLRSLKDGDEEHEKNKLDQLLTESREQDITCDEFFIKKYQESISLSPSTK